MMVPEGEDTAEAVITEFVLDISGAVKKHWPRLANLCGFSSAHMIIGALEQVKQKVLHDLNEELEETLRKQYFDPPLKEG